MQDLKEVTQDVHYENYRAQKLMKPSQGAAVERKEYDDIDFLNSFLVALLIDTFSKPLKFVRIF